jgi:diadenosine tetraphosphatase ApaH/serine/threonine PP2A family protein phosphatase
MARAGIEHSVQALDESDRKWLGALPAKLTIGPATLVHASLDEPLDWNYVIHAEDAEESFSLQTTPVCFYGHTHLARLFTKPGAPQPKRLSGESFQLDPSGHYLINPGSIGQPRGGDPRAHFLIFDPADLTVEFAQVAYDVRAATDAILEAGLPPELAERLFHGM